MLQERDYILRLIAMSGEMIRRAMERLRGGQPAEALEMLEDAVQRLANTSPHLLARLAPEGLVTFLGAGGPVDPRVAASLAETLDAQAEALAALGRADESALARAQAGALRAAASLPGSQTDQGRARVRCAIAPSPLGAVLVGVTDTGVCAVMLGDSAVGLRSAFAAEFPHVDLTLDDAAAGTQARAVAAYLAGSAPMPDFELDLTGTDFQRTVWTALRRVPSGTTVTYAEIARLIGAPRAYRAVANACGDNHIAVLVPCHRVVRSDGGLGGYKWGIERKKQLLAREGAPRR
jgi:AraC family transcriptional regulator of adaptative response/methylated-DNA-[protein]-cysteine methyltransferase